jgi:hypothetical protein
MLEKRASRSRPRGSEIVDLRLVRIPMKPATHSKRKPATCSDLKPAGIPI